ncbi:hypothetical protein [Azospirillum sp. ST 5-10]|uniref:hypothetical protein n=1 Tax=unclassified Azospirillum TaxID=2630922 RepID=UPI003F4A591B
MDALDRCLERIAHLDRADDLLNAIRLYEGRHPVRDALVRHRATLNAARRHLETARALVAV